MNYDWYMLIMCAVHNTIDYICWVERWIDSDHVGWFIYHNFSRLVDIFSFKTSDWFLSINKDNKIGTTMMWNTKTTLQQYLSVFDVVTKQIVILNTY